MFYYSFVFTVIKSPPLHILKTSTSCHLSFISYFTDSGLTGVSIHRKGISILSEPMSANFFTVHIQYIKRLQKVIFTKKR